jgi:hypothetical protein
METPPRPPSPGKTRVYRTCLFCHADLGVNQSIEAFPVGRRIAFDAERGRLWVVCRACRRWNLSPLEERWEAVEQCEERFRSTRLRVSTGEVGLARLPEGLELVRIGQPQRPEMAAWRYGGELVRRHRKEWILGGVSAGVMVSLMATGAYGAMAAAVPGISLFVQAPSWIVRLKRRYQVVARTRSDDGELAVVRGKHVASALLRRSSEAKDWWFLEMSLGGSSGLQLDGAEAVRVLSRVMARVNRGGSSKKTVSAAVKRLEQAGSPSRIFAAAAAESSDPEQVTRLVEMLPVERAALEMATHEESERRALEGELAELELAWKEAEEIAAISDSLLLPAGLDSLLKRVKGAS